MTGLQGTWIHYEGFSIGRKVIHFRGRHGPRSLLKYTTSNILSYVALLKDENFFLTGVGGSAELRPEHLLRVHSYLEDATKATFKVLFVFVFIARRRSLLKVC